MNLSKNIVLLIFPMANPNRAFAKFIYNKEMYFVTFCQTLAYAEKSRPVWAVPFYFFYFTGTDIDAGYQGNCDR